MKASRKVVGGVYTCGLRCSLPAIPWDGPRFFSKCAPFWVVAPVALCCWSLGTQSVAGAPVDALAVGFHLHARDPGEMVGSDPS